MTALTLPHPLALLLCGVALLLWPSDPAALRGRPAMAGRVTARRGRSRASRAAAGRADRVLLIVVPTAVLLLVAPETWWLLVVAAVLVVVRSRRSRRDTRDDSQRCAALAVHHELLAACLDAGMPIGAALRAVADAVPASARAPTGEDPWARLDAVAAMLELGAGPDAAWAPADDDAELRPLAAAARRSAEGGAGLADAVRDQARLLRSAVETAARRATGRAGVLMVAPLGLCFLPAFLCLGLAPVVLALLGQLQLF